MKSLVLFGSLIVLLAIPCQAQQGPHTVRDYFMLIPGRYFSLDCCGIDKPMRKAKEEYLSRYLNVEDTANGYMSGYGDAAQEGFAMALFKRAEGSHLIGFYTYGEGGVEDTPWTVFLNYRNGRWTDVSRTVVRGYNKEKYIYELPRHGTTIAVFAKDEMGQDFYKGKKLYDLQWKDGKFIRK